MSQSTDLNVRRITTAKGLEQLAEDIAAADWDDDNDMGDYSAESLASFVADNRRVLVVAHRGDRLAGIASAAIQLKPYEHELWFYVDEVDVAVSFRKQGIGKAMMKQLLSIAKDEHCSELWLGTETDNEAALRLYESIDPDETERFVGFTFKL